MNYCSNCGKELTEDHSFCPHCGTAIISHNSVVGTDTSTHTIPKCTCCGHIGEWKSGPLFRPMDYVIGLGLLILGFLPGFVYMVVVGLIRSDKKNREKICTKCNARNLFTYIY